MCKTAIYLAFAFLAAILGQIVSDGTSWQRTAVAVMFCVVASLPVSGVISLLFRRRGTSGWKRYPADAHNTLDDEVFSDRHMKDKVSPPHQSTSVDFPDEKQFDPDRMH